MFNFDFLKLNETVASDSLVDENDIKPVKKALSKMGHYKPPEWGITEIPDQDMFKGIKSFQEENNLRVDGVMKPGGETEKALNKILEKATGRKNPFDQSLDLSGFKAQKEDELYDAEATKLRKLAALEENAVRKRMISVDYLPKKDAINAEYDNAIKGIEKQFAKMDKWNSETPKKEIPQKSKEKEKVPVINMTNDREKAILEKKKALFEIKNNPKADSSAPPHEIHGVGWDAVRAYKDTIEAESKKQGVDPDLVKAIIYMENSHGWYGYPFENGKLSKIKKAKSQMPMNIRPNKWKQLAGKDADLSDSKTNIKAGVALIKELQDRVDNPTPAKVGTLYNHIGKENVSDFGARLSKIYEEKLWEKDPLGIVDLIGGSLRDEFYYE